ncbi:hypothetical protein [Streptomyces venezuelae]|uniref:hypothetical protein n=1 Tax=Streptomyces venezuelae TaxID=54571 RepID=UPI00332D24C2
MVGTGTPANEPVSGGDAARDKVREVGPPAGSRPRHRPRLQNEGGTADDHGRRPGVASRTGTGAVSGDGRVVQPPADAERVRKAGETDEQAR